MLSTAADIVTAVDAVESASDIVDIADDDILTLVLLVVSKEFIHNIVWFLILKSKLSNYLICFYLCNFG